MAFVDDSTGTLGTDAIGRINAATSAFDVKVVVASTGSRGELDATVGRLMNSANTVAIGVDPIHHYTFTHFGTGAGIASGDYQTIARAGNGEFKAGHWEQGIEAIIASANAASVRTSARSSVIVQQPVTVVEHPAPIWPFIAGGVGFVFAAVLLVRWMKRRQADQAKVLDGFREEAAHMRSRNIEEQGWHDKFQANQPATEHGRARARKLATKPPMRNMKHIVAPLPEVIVNEQIRGKYSKSLAARRIIAPPPAMETQATMPEERDRAAYLRSRDSYPAAPAPVVQNYYGGGNGGNDLALGYMIGSNIAQRDHVMVREEHRQHTETPAPSSSSSSDWGSSSGSSDSGSGGGGFDSGGGGGFDGGSGGGDF